MKSTLTAAVFAAALGIGSASVSAAPSAMGGVSAGLESPVTEVRMMRKKKMMMKRKMRRRSVGGNTKNPALSPMQQNRGQTSGGPARR